MPLIHLKLSGAPDVLLAQQLTAKLSQLTKDVLNKRNEVTAVTVSFVPEELWFINLQSLAELGMKSFHLTVSFGESTSLKSEKAKFIESVHAALSMLIDRLHPVSYTTLQELRADAYGYEGLTVENKFITSQNNNQAIIASGKN